MNRALLLSRFAIVAIAAVAATRQATADPPDFLHNYRFIPSRSTVHVTGGFAGLDWDLAIRGRFGLVTGYDYEISPTAHVPHLAPFARFVDVEAILYNPLSLAPAPVPGWDLDDTLNLSGLDGTFNFGEPRILFFRGEDGQGQPIHLKAVQRGRLLHLTGANDPLHAADGGVCSDCFGYKIDALAHLAPYADFTLDGKIDRHDLERLTSNLGAVTGASFEHGDADGDGDVDGEDVLVWQRDFGAATSLSEFDDAGLGNGAVPEPSTVMLLFSGALFLSMRCGRMARRR